MHDKTYSFSGKIYALIGISTLVLMSCFTIVFAYSSWKVLDITRNETRNTLDIYNVQVADHLRKVDYFLVDINTRNADVALLASGSNAGNHYQNITRLQNYLDSAVSSLSSVNSLFAWFPSNDTFIVSERTANRYEIPLSTYIRDALRTDPAFLEETVRQGKEWTMRRYDGRWYAVKLYDQGGCYLGAWASLDHLTEPLSELRSQGSLIFFMDPEGNVLYSGEDPIALPDGTIEDNQRITLNGISYLATSVALDYSDARLCVLTPVSSLISSLKYGLVLTVIVLAAGAALMAGVFHEVRNFITRPLQLLRETAGAISGGQTEQRIDTTDVHARELLEICTSFNRMIDSIEHLRIDVYEEQLSRKDIEMHYLQSQVSPHFFINCLNLIGFLADGTPEHSAVVQQLISELAIHLRYTLTKRGQVPLMEEIALEQNYIRMNEIRFPGCLSVKMEIDKDAEDASVFPLILLMFTENTFKHNLVMGEPLSLIIRAKRTGGDGNHRVELTHIDSGDGFDEDILQEYRQYAAGQDPAAGSGGRIGLYNVIRRITLYYGESATMTLSNEPGMGARIDMNIPYIPYKETETKTGQKDLQGISRAGGTS